jgi:truncated hemoglobin YjbI
MSDMNDRSLFAADEADGVRPEAAPTVDETPAVPTAEHPPVGVNGIHGEPTWRNEAGRKGAKRVHQLIEAGRLYEREHGLKSGRQRLRQLIELGKRYEEEHGVRPVGKKRQGKRLSRTERDEVLATLLECLIKIAKPSFRAELARLAGTLSNVEKGQAA